jgi:hypothetical protein
MVASTYPRRVRRCPVFEITEAVTRLRTPAAGSIPSAHAAALMASGAVASYKTLVVDARNDAQGAPDAWRRPV